MNDRPNRDDWQGVDLTTCMEEVTHKHHDRMLAELARHITPEKQAEIDADIYSPYRPWDTLHVKNKQDNKQALVPIITDAIDVALTQWEDQSKARLERVLDQLDEILSDEETVTGSARDALQRVSALAADARIGFKEV